jgi:hypothetical protein
MRNVPNISKIRVGGFLEGFARVLQTGTHLDANLAVGLHALELLDALLDDIALDERGHHGGEMGWAWRWLIEVAEEELPALPKRAARLSPLPFQTPPST